MYAYFAEIIERTGTDRLKLYLYHFPQMSGLPITAELIEKLLKSYPDTIAGMKDSAGVWDDTEAIIKNFPSMDVYSSSESLLLRNLRAGGSGCISATANVNVRAIRNLIDQHTSDTAEQLQDSLNTVRVVFEQRPLFQSLKGYIATRKNNPVWMNMRPPLLSISKEEVNSLLAELANTPIGE